MAYQKFAINFTLIDQIEYEIVTNKFRPISVVAPLARVGKKTGFFEKTKPTYFFWYEQTFLIKNIFFFFQKYPIHSIFKYT